MPRILPVVLIALALAACEMASTVTEGFKQAHAVEGDLEQATGVRPQVGFSRQNGQLRSVTAGFPRLYEDKPLGKLAETVRAAVGQEFKQVPDAIVLAFAVSNPAAR